MPRERDNKSSQVKSVGVLSVIGPSASHAALRRRQPDGPTCSCDGEMPIHVKIGKDQFTMSPFDNGSTTWRCDAKHQRCERSTRVDASNHYLGVRWSAPRSGGGTADLCEVCVTACALDPGMASAEVMATKNSRESPQSINVKFKSKALTLKPFDNGSTTWYCDVRHPSCQRKTQHVRYLGMRWSDRCSGGCADLCEECVKACMDEDRRAARVAV